MRTNCYNSSRLNLQLLQRRVGLVLTDIKKRSDHFLFILLFIVGMTWLPARANTISAENTSKPASVTGVRPYAASAETWMTFSYTPGGTDNSVIVTDKISYRIYVRNTSTTDAMTNVRIIDTLPLHTTYYGSSPTGGLLNNGVLTYNVGTLNPGQVFFYEITVEVVGPLTGVDYINNTGYVDFGDGTPLHHTNAPAVENSIGAAIGTDKGWPATRTPVDNGMSSVNWMSAVPQPTGPNGTIRSEDIITYVIHVKNTGTQKLTNIQITDYVPVYTTFLDSDGPNPDANNLLTWTINSLDPGQSDTRTFRVRVAVDLTGAKSIINTAFVNNGNGKGSQATLPALAGDATQPDLGGVGKESTVIPIVSVVSFESWKIVLNSSGEATVSPGEELSYIIYVRNTGNTTIPDLRVSDPIPDFTTFTTATDGGVFLEGSGTVNWRVNNLGAGNVATLHFKVKVSPVPDGIKTIDNTARVQIGGNSDETSKPTFRCDPKEVGCDKGTVTSIKVTSSPQGLFISNVVTPNNDGKNDYFIVRGIDKNPGSQLFIFNRWGGVVYQNKNYQNNWNAIGLSEGTYYYRLELKETTGEVTEYKGWVMIIR